MEARQRVEYDHTSLEKFNRLTNDELKQCENQSNGKGINPLIWAAEADRSGDRAKLLLRLVKECDYDVNYKDAYSRTALWYMMNTFPHLYGEHYHPCVFALLEKSNSATITAALTDAFRFFPLDSADPTCERQLKKI